MNNEKINENLELEEDSDYVVLTMDDGTQKNFYFEDEFEFNGKRYFCISPAEEMEDVNQGELLIYQVDESGEEFMLNPIEDEALLEEVYNEYCRRYDEEMAFGCGCDCGHDDCDCEHGDCDCEHGEGHCDCDCCK